LGDGKEYGEDPAQTAREAGALYELLEREVIPQFYTRDAQGIPVAWVARMRASMARLTARFSANRVVREYTEQFYLPAAQAYRERAADNGAAAARVAAWQQALRQAWNTLRFDDMSARSEGEAHIFEVKVYLGALNPESVSVELYGEANHGDPPVKHEMQRVGQSAAGANVYVYHARIVAHRAAGDYTARIVPRHAGAAAPLEAPYILWQR
jgi:glycogen phosphorylase